MSLIYVFENRLTHLSRRRIQSRLLAVVAPPLISNIIEDKIKEKLSELGKVSDLRPFICYAGEGLAEAIATFALKKFKETHPDIELDIDGVGRNRFRKQFWQRIFVTDLNCSILVRK